MSLQTKAAEFPLPEPDSYLPRRVLSIRPSLPETLEAHAMFPAGLFPLFSLFHKLPDERFEIVRLLFARRAHGGAVPI